MSDNLTAPAAGAILATDEIDGVHHALTKIEFGPPDSAKPVSEDDPLPTHDAALDQVRALLAGTLRTHRAAVTPIATPALAAALVALAQPGALAGFTGWSNAAGFFLVFDAAVVPADGAVTPIDCIPYPVAGAPLGIDYSGAPLAGAAGIVIVFSTDGPFNKVASPTAFISAKVLA